MSWRRQSWERERECASECVEEVGREEGGEGRIVVCVCVCVQVNYASEESGGVVWLQC